MAGAGGDVEYSIALGEKALGLMKAYRTSARPADYETWFTYAAGSIGALSKAIDSCIRRNGTITDHDLHQIYEQHVSPLRFFERMASRQVSGRRSPRSRPCWTPRCRRRAIWTAC